MDDGELGDGGWCGHEVVASGRHRLMFEANVAKHGHDLVDRERKKNDPPTPR